MSKKIIGAIIVFLIFLVTAISVYAPTNYVSSTAADSGFFLNALITDTRMPCGNADGSNGFHVTGKITSSGDQSAPNDCGYNALPYCKCYTSETGGCCDGCDYCAEGTVFNGQTCVNATANNVFCSVIYECDYPNHANITNRSYSCNGTGSCNVLEKSNIIPCDSGCCYFNETANNAGCVDNGTGDLNFFNFYEEPFGYFDDGTNDYCLENQLFDCEGDTAAGDAQCWEGGRCNASGICVEDFENSHGCIRDSQCKSGQCIDFTCQDTRSLIENFNELKNMSVYLLMKVQYWNGSAWEDKATILNDTSTRRIEQGTLLKLDDLWNANPWNTSNSSLGTYRVYAAATDENDVVLLDRSGTPVNASYSFSIAGSGVTLISPVDDTTTALRNIMFKCSAFDSDGLANISLWTNITGTWQRDYTKNVNGTYTELNITINNIDYGTYIWSCQAYDNASEEFWAVNNWTLNIINVTTGLSCWVTTSCNYTDVMHLSSYTNSHGELNNQSNYDLKVCCRDINGLVDLGTNCSSPTNDTLVKLSGQTSATAELGNETNYAYPVCLNSEDPYYFINCSYRTTECTSDEVCVVELTNNTNAHLGDCLSADYDYKVCCGLKWTCDEFGDNTLWNIICDDSNITNSIKTDSIMFNSDNINCNVSDSTENNVICIDSTINDSIKLYTNLTSSININCNTSHATENNVICTDSIINDSIKLYTNLTSSININCNTSHATENNVICVDSTINDSIKLYTNITNSTNINCNTSHSVEENVICTDSIINDSIKINSIITSSIVLSSNNTRCDVIDSYEKLVNCTDSNITNGSWKQNSTIIDSNNDNCDVIDSYEELVNCTDSNITDDSYKFNSTVISSNNTNCNVSGSQEINVNCINSTINDSIKINSTIIGSTVLSSNNTRCDVIDSWEELVNCTDSNITNGSYKFNSIVISSNNDNCDVIDSYEELVNCINSNITNESTAYDCRITDNSLLYNSTCNNSNITNSTKINSTIIDSIVRNSVNYNCTIVNTTETGITCYDANITDGCIKNTNGTVTYLGVNHTGTSICLPDLYANCSYYGDYTIDNTTRDNCIGSIITNSTKNITNLTNSINNNCTVYNSTEIKVRCTNSVINDSWKYNSTITDSIVLNSTNYNCTIIESTETNVNCTLSDITYDSNIIDSNVTNYCDIESSTLENSWCDNSSITESEKYNSTIINSTVENSINHNCTIVNTTEINIFCYNANITDGCIQNINGTVYYLGINYTYNGTPICLPDLYVNCTFIGTNIWIPPGYCEESTITDSIKINSTVINSTNDNCTVYNSTEINVSCTDSTINHSKKYNSTIIDSTVINSINYNCTIINTTEIGITCYDANITDGCIQNINGTVIYKEVTHIYNGTPICLPDLYVNCTFIGNNTIDSSTMANCVGSVIINSKKNDSTIINSTNDNCTVIVSTEIWVNCTDSILNDSTKIHTTIINSTNVDCSNVSYSYEEDSYCRGAVMNDTNLIGSSITDAIAESCNATNSTLINVTCRDSVIINSNLTKVKNITLSYNYNCNVSNSPGVNEYNVSCTDSKISGDSDIRDSDIINSWLTNVSATADSIINNSILTNCVVINSTVKNYQGSDCYIVNAIIDPPGPLNNLTGSDITDSEVYYSDVLYSNVSNSSYVWNSTINYSNIINSTIDNSNVSNSNITNSVKINSTIINSTVIDSYNINCDVINGVEIGKTCNNSCGDGICDKAAECNFCILDCNFSMCCPNGQCNTFFGEDYNNCPSDCAPPAPPPTRKAGGGAGAFLTACYENWNCSDWGTCLPNGTQYRECWDISSCDEKYNQRIISRVYTTKRPPLTQNCTYIAVPTCYDRIQNQDETDVDCGGSVCPKCGDGRKCLTDNDCINRCDPVRGICYTPVLPEVEIPAPLKKPSIWPYLLILFVIIVIVISVYTYLNLDKMAFYQRYKARKEEKFAETRRGAEEEKKKLIELERKKREAVKELHKRLRKEYADKLEMFLDRAVDKGYKKSNIKNVLISKGWPREFVNKYIDAYFKEHHIWIKKLEKTREKTADFAKLKTELKHINMELRSKK